eukprot:Sspe_Gene.24636::Locus_9797_Transcript_6_10_Confidence_0.233_Length_2781::g.24636::m.24636
MAASGTGNDQGGLPPTQRASLRNGASNHTVKAEGHHGSPVGLNSVGGTTVSLETAEEEPVAVRGLVEGIVPVRVDDDDDDESPCLPANGSFGSNGKGGLHLSRSGSVCSTPLEIPAKPRRLRHISNWPHRPVLCRWASGKSVRMYSADSIPLNPAAPHPFETAVFKGRAVMCVRDAPNCATNPWAPGERFATKRRKLVLTIQGRFKRRLRFDEAECGLMWTRALSNLPWAVIVNSAETVIATLSPGAKANIRAESYPHFLNLLAAGADSIHIWDPANDPPEERWDPVAEIVQERTQWRTTKARQAYFKKRENATKHYWEPDLEYTFDFYGDKVDLARFIAKIPTLPEFSLQKFFNGQPFPFLAQTTNNEVLWHFEMWHESLLPDVPRDEMAATPPVSPVSGPVVLGSAGESFSNFGSLATADGLPNSMMYHKEPSFHSCHTGYDEIGREDPAGYSERSAYSGYSTPIASTPCPGPRDPNPRRLRPWHLRNRWAEWDKHLGGPSQPRPSDSLCAAVLAIGVIGIVAFVGTWWYKKLWKRLEDSLTTLPSLTDMGQTGIALIATLFVCFLVGTLTGFLKRPPGKAGMPEVLQVVIACVVSIPEEAMFRCILIPNPSTEKVPTPDVVLWTLLSITCFVAHFPLIATTCVPIGYPTFIDPRFLALAGLVGGACSGIYLATSSLWPPAVLHAVAAGAWLIAGGGSRRLRRVRIILPQSERRLSTASVSRPFRQAQTPPVFLAHPPGTPHFGASPLTGMEYEHTPLLSEEPHHLESPPPYSDSSPLGSAEP